MARLTKYRPHTVDKDFASAMLHQIEHQYAYNSKLAVAGGVVLSLFAPIIFAAFFYMFGLGVVFSYGFFVGYLIVAAIVLPLAFFLAHKFRGGILDAATNNTDIFESRFLARQIGPTLVLLEVINIGPRLTLWGWSRLKDRRTFGRMSIDRLAEAIVTLATANGGVPPVQLLQQGEDPDELEPLLSVLMLHDLADTGKRGDRVWITSHAKAKLGLPV